jgi:hypothetical protein
MPYLTPDTVDSVRGVVDAANNVHGYAHVRQASLAAVRRTAIRQLDELAGTRAPDRDGYPVAG